MVWLTTALTEGYASLLPLQTVRRHRVRGSQSPTTLPTVTEYSCDAATTMNNRNSKKGNESSRRGVCDRKQRWMGIKEDESIVKYLFNRWVLSHCWMSLTLTHTHTLCLCFNHLQPLARPQSPTSAGFGIRWCSAKGLAATGSFWHRRRNFHYNDLGCGAPGMHPQ